MVSCEKVWCHVTAIPLVLLLEYCSIFRSFEEEGKARMGIVECLNHNLVEPFNVLYEKEGRNLSMVAPLYKGRVGGGSFVPYTVEPLYKGQVGDGPFVPYTVDTSLVPTERLSSSLLSFVQRLSSYSCRGVGGTVQVHCTSHEQWTSENYKWTI